jgi:acetylornithine deacetylase/succinyl-diaminopimelate desuccinylase-like protein
MRSIADVIAKLDSQYLPVHVTPVVRDMANAMAAASSPQLRIALRQLVKPSRASAALRLLGDRAATFAPLLRNTVSATIVHASDKVNVIPSEVSLVLDGRLLPGFGPDDLLSELRAVLGEDVALEVVRHDPGPAEPDMTLFKTLGDVLRHLDPGCVPVPLLMAGVTDGRFFSRLGIQTYGFMPMRLPAGFDFWQYIHAADERIPAAAVDFGSEGVYRALEKYGREGNA